MSARRFSNRDSRTHGGLKVSSQKRNLLGNPGQHLIRWGEVTIIQELRSQHSKDLENQDKTP